MDMCAGGSDWCVPATGYDRPNWNILLHGHAQERLQVHTKWEGVKWIHLAEDREQWQTLMNTVMNLQVLI
jgi:Mlc titration factor MtfA (ptsG expression regulator)